MQSSPKLAKKGFIVLVVLKIYFQYGAFWGRERGTTIILAVLGTKIEIEQLKIS